MSQRTIIIGAGMGGIAAALAATARGEQVLVLERQAVPGGKARNLLVGESEVAAGPTVLTMRWVFERLLALHNTQLSELVDLKPANVLARHSWRDGERLDLFADIEQSANAIGAMSGPQNAEGYRRFCGDSQTMFETLKQSYIAAQRPNPLQLIHRIGLFDLQSQLALKPLSTLWSALGTYFPDQRLRQLFGRYATYCGSSPFQAPATLMLVAHVEQAGVWMVQGGIAALAKALTKLAARSGAEFRYGADVSRIEVENGQVSGVQLTEGSRYAAARVIFNGDAAALNDLTDGTLGSKALKFSDRSLSARTWCIEAESDGFPLSHHSVFFSNNYRQEFNQILRNHRMPDDPTVYICAQDRSDDGARLGSKPDKSVERMLFIVNAPANGDTQSYQQSETERCLDITLSTLQSHGLNLTRPSLKAVATTPQGFDELFPGSGGALYGRASHGWTASFKRQGSKTKIPGLYLAGGSVHPGPGVPMAVLSGMMAAEQLVKDRALTRKYHPAATFGGTSTA